MNHPSRTEVNVNRPITPSRRSGDSRRLGSIAGLRSSREPGGNSCERGGDELDRRTLSGSERNSVPASVRRGDILVLAERKPIAERSDDALEFRFASSMQPGREPSHVDTPSRPPRLHDALTARYGTARPNLSRCEATEELSSRRTRRQRYRDGNLSIDFRPIRSDFAASTWEPPRDDRRRRQALGR